MKYAKHTNVSDMKDLMIDRYLEKVSVAKENVPVLIISEEANSIIEETSHKENSDEITVVFKDFTEKERDYQLLYKSVPVFADFIKIEEMGNGKNKIQVMAYSEDMEQEMLVEEIFNSWVFVYISAVSRNIFNVTLELVPDWLRTNYLITKDTLELFPLVESESFAACYDNKRMVKRTNLFVYKDALSNVKVPITDIVTDIDDMDIHNADVIKFSSMINKTDMHKIMEGTHIAYLDDELEELVLSRVNSVSGQIVECDNKNFTLFEIVKMSNEGEIIVVSPYEAILDITKDGSPATIANYDDLRVTGVLSKRTIDDLCVWLDDINKLRLSLEEFEENTAKITDIPLMVNSMDLERIEEIYETLKSLHNRFEIIDDHGNLKGKNMLFDGTFYLMASRLTFAKISYTDLEYTFENVKAVMNILEEILEEDTVDETEAEAVQPE